MWSSVYSLLRTADGGASVTVCQDKTGTDESLRVAREWIQKNASSISAGAPAVSEGSVILQLVSSMSFTRPASIERRPFSRQLRLSAIGV
jgi:hypothetical protein